MPRAQNAHAMVNSGFLFKLKGNVVEECGMLFGGISSSFVHSTQTEAFLKGKNLYDKSTLQQAFKFLDAELVVEDSPPNASAEYRKKLAISLFYKVTTRICELSQTFNLN